jgi:hypothetical protein
MTVYLNNITFNNLTGILIQLTIEAPISNPVYGPTPVQGVGDDNNPVTISIDPNCPNCSSVRVVVADPDHGGTQDFVLAQQETGQKGVYLMSVEANYNIDISGRVEGATDS